MTELLIANVNCIISTPVPFIAKECVLDGYTEGDETVNGIFTPVPPGVTRPKLPILTTEIVDTSPEQIIGCVNNLQQGNEQAIINIFFPNATEGDGIVNKANNDIWVYRNLLWENVGPTPGRRVIVTTVVPPWNEVVTTVSKTRTMLSVNSLPYSLQLLSELIVTTKTKLGFRTTESLFIDTSQVTLIGEIPTKIGFVESIQVLPEPAVQIVVGEVPIAVGFYPNALNISAGESTIDVTANNVTISAFDGRAIPTNQTQVQVASLLPTVESSNIKIKAPATNNIVAASIPSISIIDPYFSSVSLLLHMDGSNGSTIFTDSSSSPKTITAYGSTQVSTAQSKFGDASMLLAVGDYITASSVTLGTSDFTIEVWIYPSSVTDYQALISQGDTDSTGCFVFGLSGSVLYLTADGSTRYFGSVSIAANQWTHIAVTRSGSTYTFFVNGVLDGTATYDLNHTETPFKIGRGYDGILNYSGYMDELRVTMGVVRYASAFTPPTAAFLDV
jgi:hypothetical protein